MAERTGRTTRRTDGKQAAITSRVVEALMALRALGCARTTDLMRVTGHPTGNAFNKWMRKLVDAGLVRVFTADLTEENSYGLARAGWDAIVEALPGLQGEPKPTAREPTPHRLLITAFWCLFAAAIRRNDGWTLKAWPEEVLREIAKDGIVPDLLLSVRGSALLVEADVGTEGAAFLLAKAERLEAAKAVGPLFGFDSWRIVWVVEDDARARFLARTLGAKACLVDHLIINLEDVDVDTVLAHPCELAGRPDLQATIAGDMQPIGV